MRISNTIEIRNTPATVFYWLEDPGRAAKWMTSVSTTEILQKTAGVVGTTFRETVEENGRGTELRGVVTAFVPNKRLSFHLEGDFNSVDVHYALEEHETSTRLTQRAEIRFKGTSSLLGIFFAPVVRKKLLQQARGELAVLKKLCEQEAL
jgi:uncharacterized protein YndB with AHSA1/START domain